MPHSVKATLFKSTRLAISLIAVASVAGGCCRAKPATSAALAPATKPAPPPPEPWINAKAMFIMPLSSPAVPATGPLLIDSLVTAWKAGLKLPDPAAVVSLTGGTYPAVGDMKVNLSGASVLSGKDRPQVGALVPTTQQVTAGQLSMVADPIETFGAKLHTRVSATGVTLSLQKDKAGSPILLMTDAADGVLDFDASTADLEKLTLAMAKAGGAKRAIRVRDVKLKFEQLGQRSLRVEMYVGAVVGFVPAGLRFTARVDVDEAMNATLSDLTVDGDDVLGPLVVPFVRPQFQKLNGKTRPLLGFPNPATKLKDVRIIVGPRVMLKAAFGR